MSAFYDEPRRQQLQMQQLMDAEQTTQPQPPAPEGQAERFANVRMKPEKQQRGYTYRESLFVTTFDDGANKGALTAEDATSRTDWLSIGIEHFPSAFAALVAAAEYDEDEEGEEDTVPNNGDAGQIGGREDKYENKGAIVGEEADLMSPPDADAEAEKEYQRNLKALRAQQQAHLRDEEGLSHFTNANEVDDEDAGEGVLSPSVAAIEPNVASHFGLSDATATNNNISQNNISTNNNLFGEEAAATNTTSQIDLLSKDPFEALWRRRETLTRLRDEGRQQLAIERRSEIFAATMSKLKKVDVIRKARKQIAVERKAEKVIRDLQQLEEEGRSGLLNSQQKMRGAISDDALLEELKEEEIVYEEESGDSENMLSRRQQPQLTPSPNNQTATTTQPQQRTLSRRENPNRDNGAFTSVETPEPIGYYGNNATNGYHYDHKRLGLHQQQKAADEKEGGAGSGDAALLQAAPSSKSHVDPTSLTHDAPSSLFGRAVEAVTTTTKALVAPLTHLGGNTTSKEHAEGSRGLGDQNGTRRVFDRTVSGSSSTSTSVPFHRDFVQSSNVIVAFPHKQHMRYAPKEICRHFPNTAKRLKVIEDRIKSETERPLKVALDALVGGDKTAGVINQNKKKTNAPPSPSAAACARGGRGGGVMDSTTPSTSENGSFVGNLLASITPSMLKSSSVATGESTALLQKEGTTPTSAGVHEMHLPLDSLDPQTFNSQQRALKKGVSTPANISQTGSTTPVSKKQAQSPQYRDRMAPSSALGTDSAVVNFLPSPPATTKDAVADKTNEVSPQQEASADIVDSGAFDAHGFHLTGDAARPPYPFLPSSDAYASALSEWLFDHRRKLSLAGGGGRGAATATTAHGGIIASALSALPSSAPLVALGGGSKMRKQPMHALSHSQQKRRELARASLDVNTLNAKKKREALAKERLSDHEEYLIDIKMAQKRRGDFLKARKSTLKEVREDRAACFKIRRLMLPTMALLNSSVGRREIRDEYHAAKLENKKKLADTKKQTSSSTSGRIVSAGNGMLSSVFSRLWGTSKPASVAVDAPLPGDRTTPFSNNSSDITSTLFPKNTVISKLIVPHSAHHASHPLTEDNDATLVTLLQRRRSSDLSSAASTSSPSSTLSQASSTPHAALGSTIGEMNSSSRGEGMMTRSDSNIVFGDALSSATTTRDKKRGSGTSQKSVPTVSPVKTLCAEDAIYDLGAFGGVDYDELNTTNGTSDAESQKKKFRSDSLKKPTDKTIAVPVKMYLRDGNAAKFSFRDSASTATPAPSSAAELTVVEMEMHPMTTKEMQNIISANLDKATHRRDSLLKYRKNRLAAKEVIRKKRTIANLKRRKEVKMPLLLKEREAFEADYLYSHRNKVELERHHEHKEIVEAFEEGKIRLMKY